MSTPPVSVRPSRKPIDLTRLTTIFALTFGLAFGICAVSGISLSDGGNARSAQLLISTAMIMGAVCVVFLMAIAVFALIRSSRRRRVTH